MQCNVLISSAGRRVTLLQLFRGALEDLGLDGRVLAIDCSRTSPAFHVADRGFQVPPLVHPEFVDTVLELCRSEHVRLLIPTIDPELPVYSANRHAFAAVGTTVAVSSAETAAICGDKVRTNQWLLKEGFDTVRQWHGPAIREVSRFPVIIKPRFGSASIGVHVATSREELQLALRGVKEPTIEELAAGAEHTVNLLIGRQGVVLSVVPHRRLEVRAGEVSKGVTTKDPRLLDLACRLGVSLPGAFGPLNFQCFLENNRAPRIIEINARFGGGYPLAHRAGVNFPKWLIEESLGLTSSARFDNWEDGLAMLRYDEAIFVRRETIA